MSRRNRQRFGAAGAFGNDRSFISDRELWAKHESGELYAPKPKEPKPEKSDDGAPYERLGAAFHELYVEISEQRRAAMWVSASPFMILLLKELITKLTEVCGTDGTFFLAGLGIESADDLDEMNDLHADTIVEMLGAAALSIPHEVLESFGYGEHIAGMRAGGHNAYRTRRLRHGEPHPK